MFPGRYFAKRYFTGSYFPVGGPATINVGAFTNTRVFGSPTLISNTAQANLYITYINGVDVSKYVMAGPPAGQGHVGTFQTNSRGTWNFTTRDVLGAASYSPVTGDTVLVVKSTTGLVLFRGFVDTTSKSLPIGSTVLIQTQVKCIDVGVIADRRIVHGITPAMGSLAEYANIVDFIMLFMNGTGVSFVRPGGVSPLNGLALTHTFNYVTVTEALNQIANEISMNWVIDNQLNLRFYDVNSGLVASPQNITDTTKELLDFSVGATRARWANRWYAKSDQNIPSTQVDTYTVTNPAGDLAFDLTQPGPSGDQLPTVTVNGVQVNVALFAGSVAVDPMYTFVYVPLFILWLNQNVGTLTMGDVVAITYPGPLPYVAIAEDPTSIALDGLSEDTVEIPSVTDKNVLQAAADGALERGVNIPLTVMIKTRTDGYAVGQTVNVNRTIEQVNDDFMITSLSSREIGVSYFEHTLGASNLAAQLAGNPAQFYGNIIRNVRMRNLNVIEHIIFNLAVSTPPLTNPGLTTGITPAIKSSQKNGTLGWVTLIWGSVNAGTLTTQDIVIDILKNDVSIFGTKPKVVFPAGYPGEVKIVVFKTDPFTDAIGDVFTVNVIDADPLAMDGVLDMVWLG